MLNIEKKEAEGVLTLALEGRLDTTTAPDLEELLKEVLPDTKEMVFDFEKLDYISSAGLRVLLFAHKSMSKTGSMKVVKVSPEVNEIFEVTGFTDILTIE